MMSFSTVVIVLTVTRLIDSLVTTLGLVWKSFRFIFMILFHFNIFAMQKSWGHDDSSLLLLLMLRIWMAILDSCERFDILMNFFCSSALALACSREKLMKSKTQMKHKKRVRIIRHCTCNSHNSCTENLDEITFKSPWSQWCTARDDECSIYNTR